MRGRGQSQSPESKFFSSIAGWVALPNSIARLRHCSFQRNPAMMRTMKRIIQVRIFRGNRYYVAECFDLPVVTQAATLDELMSNVKEAIALQLEGENPADFGLAPDASILASYELEPEPQAHA